MNDLADRADPGAGAAGVAGLNHFQAYFFCYQIFEIRVGIFYVYWIHLITIMKSGEAGKSGSVKVRRLTCFPAHLLSHYVNSSPSHIFFFFNVSTTPITCSSSMPISPVSSSAVRSFFSR